MSETPQGRPQYRLLTGIDYPDLAELAAAKAAGRRPRANRRAEAGDIVDDIPESAIPGLLANHPPSIEAYPPPEPEPAQPVTGEEA